jgi:diketogulonate reductase-like aldo/keto reductase
MTPSFLYGTAWKEDATEGLVTLAIEAGFRGIDTANQRRHYYEAGVGEAVRKAIASGKLTRDDVFIQTKFTYVDGQDHRLPYDPHSTIAKQVQQSFASSLEHLHVDRLDSYVLHGPSQRLGLGAKDREAWTAMETLHASGLTRFLGISNVSLEQLRELLTFARVKPAFVQNRCYAALGWDHDVRSFCKDNEIVYQGFSLLTANVRELGHLPFRQLVARREKTPAQIVFRFAQLAGMLPLTGTTNPEHMSEDLQMDFELSGEELALVERIAFL